MNNWSEIFGALTPETKEKILKATEKMGKYITINDIDTTTKWTSVRAPKSLEDCVWLNYLIGGDQ
jgi:hypothetical protein